MRNVLALTGLLLLAGCVYPNPQHVAALNGMVGKSETDLVRAYGVPSRSFASGGSKFLAYNVHHIESFPDAGFGWGGWHRGWGGWGGWGPDIEEFNCDTTFEVKGGVVKAWTLRGNAC